MRHEDEPDRASAPSSGEDEQDRQLQAASTPPIAISRRSVLNVLTAGAAAGAVAGTAASALVGAHWPSGRSDGSAGGVGVPTSSPVTPSPTASTVSGLVADGSTDNAPLLNSLFDVAGEGAVITLPRGVLLVFGRVRPRTGLTLLGSEGLGTTIRLVDGAGAPFVLLQELSSVVIRGLRFDGGRQDPGEIALQIDSCTGVVVEDCAFVRMSHAVHAYGGEGAPGSDVVVRRNTFSEISDFAIRVSAGCTGVIVRENTIADVQKVAAPSPSAVLVESADVTVVGNTVASSSDTGVMVAGNSARNVSVVDNVLSTTLVGVFAGSGAKTVRISGNRISSDLDFGVHLFDAGGRPMEAVVTGNQVLTSGKTGVQIEGVSGVTVTANGISDPGTRSGVKASWRAGIVVTATGGGAPERVTLAANTVSRSSNKSAMAYGILIEAAGSDLHVQGNSIEGAEESEVSVPRALTAPYYIETKTRTYSSRKAATR